MRSEEKMNSFITHAEPEAQAYVGKGQMTMHDIELSRDFALLVASIVILVGLIGYAIADELR